VDVSAPETLAGALGLDAGELVAFVGAGGKTTAVSLLAVELVAAGRRVIVATTTAMLRRQMEAVGPLLLEADSGDLRAGLSRQLGDAHRVAVARADAARGKVTGLSPATVDELRASGFADDVLVEADGSKGLPLKAFGTHEPQVPEAATTVVVVAGLDALGAPLTEEHVHRAGLLAAVAGVPLGTDVSARVVTDGLRAQIARLQRDDPAPRVVVLLNKAESLDVEMTGRDIARALLDARAEPRPDRVVIGSLQQRRYRVVTREGGGT
jgi:probable selenium-dependent hydroxylase accessory protein YqeC